MAAANFTAFVVDDDPGVLKAVGRLLTTAGYATRTFSSSTKFLEEHDESIPGCAIIDLAMSGLDGLELQKRLLNAGSRRPVVFLTGHGDIATSVKAIKAGAVDFLTKPVERHALFSALQRAAEIDSVSRQKHEEMKSIGDRMALLTRREREVLRYVIAGRLNKQIAASLGTVEKTIKVHRARMMAKLGVRCVADLVRLAEKAGVVPIGEAV